jgi:hypothetical protein
MIKVFFKLAISVATPPIQKIALFAVVHMKTIKINEIRVEKI